MNKQTSAKILCLSNKWQEEVFSPLQNKMKEQAKKCDEMYGLCVDFLSKGHFSFDADTPATNGAGASATAITPPRGVS